MSHKSSGCFLHSSSLTDHSLNHLEQILIPPVVLVAALLEADISQVRSFVTFVFKEARTYLHTCTLTPIFFCLSSLEI